MASTIKNCCFKQCGASREPLDARVEVKTIPAVSGNSKDKWLVKWKSNGEAEFHTDCWKTVEALSRSRSKKVEDAAMTKEERQMVQTAADAWEQFDDLRTILEGAKRVAAWFKESKHCVAFTGAGISTSAGIGDYRGKAGKWTEEDQLQSCSLDGFQKSADGPPAKKPKTDAGDQADTEDDGVPYDKLRPTYTHEALCKLMDDGFLKYIISQNGDGLHTLSGIPDEKISELHGNVFVEVCEKCSQVYHRSYYTLDDVGSQYYEELEDYGKSTVKKPKHAVKCEKCGLSHRTGRKCEKKKCGGYLQDTIINFRDLLDVDILVKAKTNSRRSDMMLCLGTTLQVTPASTLVKRIKGNYKLAICNRQETHLDADALRMGDNGLTRGVRAFGDCDIFMREVMKNILNLEDFQRWESEREQRLEAYDKLRD